MNILLQKPLIKTKYRNLINYVLVLQKITLLLQTLKIG